MRWQAVGWVCVSVLVVGTLQAAEWPQFRGPGGTGKSEARQVPVTWSKEENVAWRAALPQPGNSSPIVCKGRVWVNCAEDPEGRQRSLYCFDQQTGKQLWVKTVDFDKHLPTHETNPYCASTPATDGTYVVTWHGSAGLFCYDLDGKEIWRRELGEFRHMWGYASSPILHDGKVIQYCGPGERIFVTALDLKTGSKVWETPEPQDGTGEYNSAGGFMGSWVTPLIARVRGKDQVLVTMPTRLVAYDPANGKVLWFCEGLKGQGGDLAYTSPMVSGNVCLVIGGYQGPSFAVQMGGGGDVTSTHRLWHEPRNPQSIGTGVIVDGYAYIGMAGPGIIQCIRIDTGEVTWRERGDDNFWGSVVQAEGRLYVTNQSGTTFVFKPNPERFELIAKNESGASSNSTPAVVDGMMILRTAEGLMAVREKN